MDTHSSLSYFFLPILRHTHAYTLDAWLTGLPSWSSLTFTVCQYENREDEGLQLENRAPFTPHTLTHTHTQLSNLLMILHRSDLHFSGPASLYIWRGSSTQRSIRCKTGQTNSGDKVRITAKVIRRKLSLMCEPNITRWRAATEPSSIFMQILRKANTFSSEPLVCVTHQWKGWLYGWRMAL